MCRLCNAGGCAEQARTLMRELGAVEALRVARERVKAADYMAEMWRTEEVRDVILREGRFPAPRTTVDQRLPLSVRTTCYRRAGRAAPTANLEKGGSHTRARLTPRGCPVCKAGSRLAVRPNTRRSGT
jgi:hypothetical protein